MFDLASVQTSIKQLGLDGWLLYDFRGSNVLARRVVGIGPDKFFSRRWFYFIPAEGEPKKLVHRIEPKSLEHLPGSAQAYLKWQELEAGVESLVQGSKKVAMEYVPRNANPYVSRVDAGTVELVKSFGVEIIPSGDLIQLFEAVWDDEQWALHQEAAKHTSAAFDLVFKFIADSVTSGKTIRETDVQQVIMDHFAKNNMFTDHAPICGVGPHSGDPHYAPEVGKDSEIQEGDFVLVDLWAKMNKPRGVYSDLTWTCFVGKEVPEKYTKVFKIVAAARDAAIEFVRTSFANNEVIQGWQVDKAARDVIEEAGYGEYFFHRLGHSIGQETHGNGANMDNLETKEERRVMPSTCFSIEPGIYMAEFGVRSEVDVFVDQNGQVHVTGPTPQTEVVALLAGR
ncbi:MAG: M24 family metallopeptidase [Gemmataceae bacterium]